MDDLEHLLDKLTAQVAARDAHVRWPSWAFTRTPSGWQAKEMGGSELLVGDTIAKVEGRVAQYEWLTGKPQAQCELPRSYLPDSRTIRSSIRLIPRSVMNHLLDRLAICLDLAFDRLLSAARIPEADFGIILPARPWLGRRQRGVDVRVFLPRS
jgi:hypothetical protein